MSTRDSEILTRDELIEAEASGLRLGVAENPIELEDAEARELTNDVPVTGEPSVLLVRSMLETSLSSAIALELVTDATSEDVLSSKGTELDPLSLQFVLVRDLLWDLVLDFVCHQVEAELVVLDWETSLVVDLGVGPADSLPEGVLSTVLETKSGVLLA